LTNKIEINLKSIIFDFDGVIAESVNIKTNAFEDLYKPFGREIAKKVIEHHKTHGGISRFEKFKLYHKEFLGIKLTNPQIKDLANQFSELVVQKIIDAPFVSGTLEFIKNNYNNYDFHISTGTPENEIKIILDKKNIRNYFKSVYGSPTLKKDHVKTIMSENFYNINEVIFVGDAESDIQAAIENGIKIIFRTHSDNLFLPKRYDLIEVENLINLEKVINNINKNPLEKK